MSLTPRIAIDAMGGDVGVRVMCVWVYCDGVKPVFRLWENTGPYTKGKSECGMGRG